MNGKIVFQPVIVVVTLLIPKPPLLVLDLTVILYYNYAFIESS